MKALILVDIQNDFLPGGALPVPEGDAVIPLANKLQPAFPLVVATQDWHPANHGSFAANHSGKKLYEQIDLNGLPQTLWPVHCVENTPGAALAASLKQDRIAKVFQKGTDPGIDSYSGLFNNGHRKSTGLGEWLKQKSATEVFVCGLATDSLRTRLLFSPPAADRRCAVRLSVHILRTIQNGDGSSFRHRRD